MFPQPLSCSLAGKGDTASREERKIDIYSEATGVLFTRISERDRGWNVVPSFGALSGRRKFTVRRHKFNKDFLFGIHSFVPESLRWTVTARAPVADK